MINSTENSSKVQQSQGLKSTETSSKESNKKEEKGKVEGDFESFLKGLITPDSANETNEEELFAALAEERINDVKGEEAAQVYHEALQSKLDEMRQPDGYASFEDATRAALRQLVSDEVLTQDEAEKIHAQAFKAAQLDENKGVLFDGRGGANDPTRAVDSLESALLLAKGMIDKFESGEEDAGTLSLDQPSSKALAFGGGFVSATPATSDSGPLVVGDQASGDGSTVEPNGNTFDGAEGFLFKPESESDGNLVVLLTASMTGNISEVVLNDAEGNAIESGKYANVGNNGREHYRFTKPGGEYPEGLMVEVKFKDGTSKFYKIPDPSQRYD